MIGFTHRACLNGGVRCPGIRSCVWMGPAHNCVPKETPTSFCCSNAWTIHCLINRSPTAILGSEHSLQLARGLPSPDRFPEPLALHSGQVCARPWERPTSGSCKIGDPVIRYSSSASVVEPRRLAHSWVSFAPSALCGQALKI